MADMQFQENISYMTPGDVAKLLLVAPVTVRQWAQKGWLRAEQTAGGHRRFLKREVERFARERGMTLHYPKRGGHRVLIVDDDAQIQRYLRELLETRDEITEVATAADGFEAGLKVRSFKPDFILLDLMMRALDGFSVCRLLKDDPATRSIRIVAMTGYHTPENVQRILDAGAERCLAKPFERQELYQALDIDVSHEIQGERIPPGSLGQLPGKRRV